MGTPAYMSPEQCRGAASLDRRADIYSLGCIIFEMLTGRPPFDHDSMGEIIAAHLYAQPPLLRDLDPSVPMWLEAVVARTLAKKPEDRQQTMEQLAGQLAEARNVTLPPMVQTYPTISLANTMQMKLQLPRRHGLVWLLAAAVGLVAGTVAVTRLTRDPPAIASAPETAPPPPAPAPAPTVAPMPPPVAVSAPVAPPPPATVTLKIDSSPPGADVYRALDGIKLGRTPLEQAIPRSGGLAVFVLKLSGYRDARVELPASGDGAADVVLSKRPRRSQPGKGDDGALDPFGR